MIARHEPKGTAMGRSKYIELGSSCSSRRRAWAGGGTRDMIGSSESAGEAPEAFRGCRGERSFQRAELVAVRGGDCQALSWFGMDRARKGPEIHTVEDGSGAEDTHGHPAVAAQLPPTTARGVGGLSRR